MARAVKNPWTEEEIEQQFRELVTDPDPAAMLVAEDVVVQNHLRLSALGERWLADIDERSTGNHYDGLFELGKHEGFVRWALFNLGKRGYEWEITVGDKRLPDGRTTIAHVSYVKGLAKAIPQAAADAWVIAKAVKSYDGVQDMPEQYLIDALFLPDNTPREVFGVQRMMRKWGKFDIPSPEALERLREYLKRAKPSAQVVVGAEIDRALRSHKKNPPKGAPPPTQGSLRPRVHVCLRCQRPRWMLPPEGIDGGWTPATGEGSCQCVYGENPPKNTPPPTDGSGYARDPGIYEVDTVQPSGREMTSQVTADSPRQAWDRVARVWGDRPTRVRRQNPGELASVELEYESLIRKGMARTLWAYAYGVWAQEDLDARDPDMNDVIPADKQARPQPIGFTIPVWIGDAPPTPGAAQHAARDLSDAIAKSEEVADSSAPMATLFALAMEIDTGEPFEFVKIAPPSTGKKPDTILLFDCGSGGCAPQRFAEEMDRSAVTGVSEEDWATMEAGDTADNEWIWDTWDAVEQSAVITDEKTGIKYTLASNDGVTFLIPDGMEWSDDEEWYVWPPEEPETHAAEEFGQCLAHMALGDGNSWFDDHKQESKGMKWEPAIPTINVAFFDDDKLMWNVANGFAKTEHTERRVRITFDSVTPGEEDDDEPIVETGWEDQEGVVIQGGADDVEDEDLDDATCNFIIGEGSVEPSSSPNWSHGTWYTQIDGNTDYQTGEQRRLSYHLYGYTEDEEKAVYEAVKLAQRRR